MPLRLLPILLVAAVLLTGCATTDPGLSRAHEVNAEQVTAVERVAKTAGVHIVWINPPTRVRERKSEHSAPDPIDGDQ